MQLRATKGRVLLGGQEPERSRLPAELHAALSEWAEVADSVQGTGLPAETELVRRRGRQLAYRVALQQGVSVEYVDPITGSVEAVGEPGRRAAEPTPWATGLTVSAIFALVVTVADLALHGGFAQSTVVRGYGLTWLPVVANLLVGAGLAPSLWLLHRRPFWRWPAYGIAAGLLIAWVCLLLVGLLGAG